MWRQFNNEKEKEKKKISEQKRTKGKKITAVPV